MTRRLLIFAITAFCFSCEQKNNQREDNTDTSKVALSNTPNSSASQTERELVDHEDKCRYANEVASLGTGVVMAPAKFDIYNDSLLTDKHVTWNMYEDEEEINICSKFFKPDYGIMHFVCIGKTEKAYKVLMNYSDTKFLPREEEYEFLTWEEYILQSFGVRRLTGDKGGVIEKLPLRINPNDQADTLVIPKGHELFCPMEINGDWMKVKHDCFYNKENNSFEGEPCHSYIDKCKNPLMGWLRWRQENKLLIDVFLMP